MIPWLVDFPQARHASDDVRRALRDLDPTAEIVYLGPMRWLVGRVRPNQIVRAEAGFMLESQRRTLALDRSKKLSRRGKYRAALAILALQGFRPVAQYIQRDADDRIVRDFRESQWRMLHMTDNDLFRAMDAQEDARRLEAEKQLTDPDHAKEAWKYAFTLSHGVTNYAYTSPHSRSKARQAGDAVA